MPNIQRIAASCAAAVFACTMASAAHAEVKLPSTVTWAVFDVGTSTYQEAVAQASAFKKRYDIDLRLIPARNDVSRIAPMRGGQVQFAQMGSGALFVMEGAFEFGTEAWGPQDVQVVALNVFPGHSGFFVNVNSDIKTASDLKGKRVPWVRGAPSLRELIRAWTAFAGLTLDDVVRVEVPGFGANLEAFLQGQTDAGIAVTLSPIPQRAHASPRGPIRWPAFPHDNEEGWERLTRVLPYAKKIVVTEGVGVQPGERLEGITYALPVIITYGRQDRELVYNVTKAIFESFPDYKDAVPSIRGFNLQPESVEYPVPFHAGAVRYYQEIGLWKDQHEKDNARLVERARVLEAAWQKQSAKGLSGEAFQEDWAKSRAAALRDANFDPIWE